jgi:hypothetical protein
MLRVLRVWSSFVAASAVLLAANAAHAADSTRGAFYVEGSPLGTGTIPLSCIDTPFGCLGGGVEGAYRVSAEFGYHFSGRHDGLVVGIRQLFLFGSLAAGTTEARVGWDIAIPIKQFELTVAPYGVAGIAYAFGDNRKAAFVLAAGAEGKFFFKDNLYAFLIPLELGGWVGSGYAGVSYEAGAGIGYAF